MGGFAAVPVVVDEFDGEVEGGVVWGEVGGHFPGDAVEGHAGGFFDLEAEVVDGEDGGGGGEDGAEDAEDGFGVVHAEGVEEFEFFEEAFGEVFGGEILSDFEGGFLGDAVGLGGDGEVELDLELFDIFEVEGDACGHGVTAPGFEEVGALGEGGDEVDAGDGAAGAFSGVAFLGEDEGRAVVDAGEFAGDDADDAGVPVWGVGDDGVVEGEILVLDELEGVVGDGAFNFLTFLVHGVELFCGDGAGAEVVGEEHIDGEGCVGESAGGVDAGAETEGDVGGFEGLVLVDAGDFGEGLDAWAVGVLDFVEAEGGEDAVFVEEGDEVGDGAEGDEVEEFLEVDGVGIGVGVFFEGFGEGVDEFEDEADGAEVGPGGVRGVEYMGVDEDGVFGGGFFGLVVVDDDDVDAFVFEEFDFGEGVGAAVEGEEEGWGGFGEGAFEDGLGHAVAFFEAERG